MSARSKQPDRPLDANAPGPSDYLYHRQRSEPDHSAPPPTRFKPARRTAPRLTSSHSTLFSNLRVVLIVLASMVFFFLGALFILKKNWQMKDAERTQGVSSFREKVESGLRRGKRETENVDPSLTSAKPESERISEAMLLARRADLLQAAGQYRQAVETYLEALRTWPALNQVRAELGRLYIRRQQYPKALALLEEAVNNEPDSPALLNDLAVAYLHDNRIPRALDLLEAATRLDAHYAPAYFNLALCRLLRSERSASRAALDQYLKLAPGDPRALKELAFLQAAEGRLNEAYSILQKALEVSPAWSPLLLDAAATSALMGKLDRAMEYLRQAESATAPAAVLRVLRGPALQQVRASEAGKALEARLVDRLNRAPPEEAAPKPETYSNEPLLSAPAPTAGPQG